MIYNKPNLLNGTVWYS